MLCVGKQVCTRTMAAGVLAALNGSKKRINQRSASFRLLRAFFQARPPVAALLTCLHLLCQEST